jgi:hypothetical protein
VSGNLPSPWAVTVTEVAQLLVVACILPGLMVRVAEAMEAGTLKAYWPVKTPK